MKAIFRMSLVAAFGIRMVVWMPSAGLGQGVTLAQQLVGSWTLVSIRATRTSALPRMPTGLTAWGVR